MAKRGRKPINITNLEEATAYLKQVQERWSAFNEWHKPIADAIDIVLDYFENANATDANARLLETIHLQEQLIKKQEQCIEVQRDIINAQKLLLE